jgi:hypothetical protein
MNTLTDEQRERILRMLRGGKSLRQIERETGHRRETIAFYGRQAGLVGGDPVPLRARTEKQSFWSALDSEIGKRLREGDSLRKIHRDLVLRVQTPHSYESLKKYVRARHAEPQALAA